MEGDHRQPSAHVQVLAPGVQHGRQGVQLAVDGDADGLKAPLGGVLLLPQRRRRHGGADHLHQLPRSLDGSLFPALHDVPGDGGRVALLAEVVQDAPQFLIGPLVHHLTGVQRRRAIHPHVQRRVVHIAEAPLSVVQLGGGHAQIEQHAVHAGDVQLLQYLADTVKVAVHQRHMIQIITQPLLGGGDGRFVPVDADETAGGQAAGDLQRVARPAQRTVHVHAVGPDAERVQAFLQQHRAVSIGEILLYIVV